MGNADDHSYKNKKHKTAEIYTSRRNKPTDAALKRNETQHQTMRSVSQ